MSTVLPTGTLDERSQTVKAVRVYLRQSKGEEQQKESIATQRAECKRLAAAIGLSDLEWARRVEYPDVDRSGDDFAGREELSRLIREARPGDLILAWKQDRLGRDMIDAAATIRELVKFRRCVLYTVETGTAPVTLDSAEQTAMVMLRGMSAQAELERIRSRTRDGLRQRARDGFCTGSLPFGYRTMLVDPNVKDRKQSKKKIEIDEAHAAIVRRVFREYLDGRGYVNIAKQLNREGAPSPRGKGWSPASIWEMLRQPAYAGEWAYGERRTIRREGTRQVIAKAPEREIIRIRRPELAIISPDEWARVQTLIAERRREWHPQSSAGTHLLSGTLKCGECGGPMRIKVCHGRRADWTKRYYICGDRLRKALCSNSVHVPADEAEAKLSEYVRSAVLGEIQEKVTEAIGAEVARVVEASKERLSEADQIREEIEKLRRERMRLVRLAAATDDPVAEVVDALSANQERAKELQKALSVATRPPLDAAAAEQLRATAIAEVDRYRSRLDGPDAREAYISLFPRGLRFKVGNGLWLIEGAASVPLIKSPDARPKCGRHLPARLADSSPHTFTFSR
jgi:DNA invertase Pin-like site-specific DNA recombinase